MLSSRTDRLWGGGTFRGDVTVVSSWNAIQDLRNAHKPKLYFELLFQPHKQHRLQNPQFSCAQSVPHRKHTVSATETNRLMLFGNAIGVYCEIHMEHIRSRDSSVGIATGYGLDAPGSISITGKFFFSPQCPDRLWGLPGLLPNWYRGRFPSG
jgi:hypothetical protein